MRSFSSSFRSKTQGNSCSVISSEKQGDDSGSGLPSGPRTGSQPPTPVRSSDACASTRGAIDSSLASAAHDVCLFLSTELARKRKKKDT